MSIYECDEHAEKIKSSSFLQSTNRDRRAVPGDAQQHRQHSPLPTSPSPLAPACPARRASSDSRPAPPARGTTWSRQCVSFRLAPPSPAPPQRLGPAPSPEPAGRCADWPAPGVARLGSSGSLWLSPDSTASSLRHREEQQQQ